MDKKQILIDGNSLIYRMFYGVREMSNSKGTPTNALYGFVNVLYKIQSEYKPDYLVVAFDLKAPTFRHKLYGEYKGGRDKMAEDLQTQLEILYDLLDKMKIAKITCEGYEADDIIGTLSLKAKEMGIRTQIITGDKDTFQLVDEDISVMYTATRSGSQFVTVDTEYINERYGVTPKELIEVKALMGDSSDNIPGVAGIGEKTALLLIKEFSNIETLYENLETQKGKRKENLENGKESAFNSKILGTVVRNIPIAEDYEKFMMPDIFTEDAVTLLKDLEFTSILKKIETFDSTDGSNTTDSKVVEFTHVKKEVEVIAILSSLNRYPNLTIYTYHDGDKGCLSARVAHLYYYFSDPDIIRCFLRGLSEIPEADNVQTLGHDLKTTIHFYEKYHAILVNVSFDTFIGAYLLSPSDQRYDLKALASRYLDENIDDEETIFGKGKDLKKLENLPCDRVGAYMVRCCDTIYRLGKVLPKSIDDNGMTKLLNEIELPLVEVLASIESAGFKIDVDKLNGLSCAFEEKLGVLTKEIYELAEEDNFNINSTKQLGGILFDKLKLPVIKKTKTGYSTNVEVLDQLVLFHPIIQKILDYRMISKLDSTYGKGMIKVIDSKTEKIFSTFQQTVAATGRLSSIEPNLQNIPVKTEMGREVRKVFIPSSEENVLVDADYSQIELRVLAHISGDENLIDAFVKGQDIHQRTAAEIFSVPIEEVTRTQRGYAKAINFGLIYGKQAFSLSKDLGISRKEAQDYIDLYFSRYPKVKEYMVNIVEEAKATGYVTTLFGRKRYIPEITSRNKILVQAGERMALNTPIQGTAADIIKIAMIRVYHRLQSEGLKSKLILQVHDELIIDALKTEEDRVLSLLSEEMKEAVHLSVPILVDAHSGSSWFEVK